MTTTSRRAVLAGIATAPVVDIWRPAPDPIYAAIERHRAALAASEAAVDISSRLRDDAPEHVAAMKVTDEADAELEASGRALAATATTLPGLAAMLTYLAGLTADDNFDGGNWRVPVSVPSEAGGEPATDMYGEERDEHFVHFLLRSVAATLKQIGGAS